MREALGLAARSAQSADLLGASPPTAGPSRPAHCSWRSQGERFDGHDHLAAAAAAGATGAVVRQGTPPVPGLILFEVPDTLRAFGLLARARRRTLKGPVVAVTGTNGKTSTKEMLAAVLRTRYATHATRANLNNLVGVPLTILEAPADTEALVVEAGANLPGEIARYREIIEPSMTVVTNAVAGHLEGFGSLAGVVEEKLSLTDGRAPRDRGCRATWARRRSPKARRPGANRRPSGRRPHPGPGGPRRVRPPGDDHRRDTRSSSPTRGLHQADNAIRVWAVVEALGLDPGGGGAGAGTDSRCRAAGASCCRRGRSRS